MADVVDATAPTVDEADLEASLDLSKKKKKKKPAKKFEEELDGAGDAAATADAGDAAAAGTATAAAATAPSSAAAAAAAGTGGGEDVSYDDMLARLYQLLHENNPDLTDRHRKKLRPPEVARVGTTRSAWVNFKESCSSMKRSMEHVQAFFLAELGTTGSIDASNRFILKGRWPPRHIENLMRRYITEYVGCHMCKSLDTELTRDPISRLYFLSCKPCGSTRSVAPIRAGFHATGRGERKKAREAVG